MTFRVRRLAGLPALLLGLMVLAIAPARAQDSPPDPAAPAQGQAQAQADAPPPNRNVPPQPRPYDRVITEDATSDEGIFTVHRIGERLY
jgi:hypothetical protein